MRQLPVIAAFGHALRSTWDNLGFAFHVSWPWMLMLVPVNVAEGIYAVQMGADSDVYGSPKFSGTFLFAIFLIAAINIIGFASIAVNWHRYILLDEMAQGWARLRLDETAWRYVGNALLIFLIVFGGGVVAVIVFVLLGAMFHETSLFFIIPASLALAIWATVMAYRLSIKLPGIALGRRDYDFGRAWADTTGNFWRFFGLAMLYLAVAAAVALCLWLVQTILGKLAGNPGYMVSVVLQVGVNWVLTILGVTMLTSLYGFFVEKREF